MLIVETTDWAIGAPTIAFAVLTGLLALATFFMARQARAQVALEKERIEAAQQAHVFPAGSIDWSDGTGSYAGRRNEVIPLKNGGLGIARNVTGRLHFPDGGYIELVSITIAPGDTQDVRFNWAGEARGGSRRRWRILNPAEVARTERAFAELPDQAEDEEERAWFEQARVVFLTLVSAGLRRGEILGLRWRDVSLADPNGATLRVRETWVRNAPDTPKSEKSERTIPLGRLAAELFDHRGRTAYDGEDERCSAPPRRAGRSTRCATRRPSAPRSSRRRSATTCGLSTTAGTRRSRTRPRPESRRRR
jgi:hypothetical protein